MDEGTPDQTCYRCGDVEVDARRHRVLRGGVEVPLEPKACAVLLELMRHAGAVVGRDALLDTVWGHRHVTPAVLSRIIAILRRELGDNADHPHLIRTVHGIGYSFVGVLEAGVDGPATALAHADASAGAQSTPPAPTPAAPRARTRPRDLAIALLALAASLTFYVWSQSKPSSPRTAAHVAPVATNQAASRTASPTLVVLPLRAVGDNRGETVLAEGLRQELTTRLSRIEGLGMISATSATIAQARQLDSSQLAEHLKATHALEGSLQEVGEQLRINLRLLDLPAGRLVWTHAYDRPVAGFATLQNDVVAEIARALSLHEVAATATRDVDPVALRQFLDLRRRIAVTGGVMDWEGPLRSLTATYPDYAQPHGLLGAMLSAHTLLRRDEAESEAKRALQLDPDEADARITLAWTAIQEGDWERARVMYDEALRLAPTDSAYRAFMGMQLGSLGYLDEGLRQVEIGIAYDPLGGVPAVNTQVYLLDALGRHDEARRSIEAALAAGSAMRYARWYNAFWRRDVAEARSAADALPENKWKASYNAVAAALGDPRQWRQARAAMDESERIEREQRNPNAINYLRLLDPRADPAASLDLTARLQRDVFAFAKLTIWMPQQHALRQTSAFQEFIRRTRILDYWRAHGFPPQCHADGDGARCD